MKDNNLTVEEARYEAFLVRSGTRRLDPQLVHDLIGVINRLAAANATERLVRLEGLDEDHFYVDPQCVSSVTTGGDGVGAVVHHSHEWISRTRGTPDEVVSALRRGGKDPHQRHTE